MGEITKALVEVSPRTVKVTGKQLGSAHQIRPQSADAVLTDSVRKRDLSGLDGHNIGVGVPGDRQQGRGLRLSQ